MNNENKKLYIIIFILVFLLSCVTTLLIVNMSKSKDTSAKKEEVKRKFLTDKELSDVGILGKYINSEYNDVVFTLNKGGKADVVLSTCSTGASDEKTVNYKVFKNKYDNYILIIDVNDDGTYSNSYTSGTLNKNEKVSKFFPTFEGCVDSIDVTYNKE